jgi:hypothetical protein
MIGEFLIVLLIVVGAVLYLGRTAWRTWNGTKGGCGGGCGCASKATADRGREATFIPAEQLALRQSSMPFDQRR